MRIENGECEMNLTKATDEELQNELTARAEKTIASLKPSDLSVLAYANNFTLWHYVTTDDTATIEGVGYFNNAVDMLRVNDLLIINIDTDGTPATKFYIVTGSDGVNVVLTKYS